MSFSVKKFRDPAAEFYPGYFWLLDTPMTEENLLAMLHDMNEHKARSICMHPSPKGWAKVTHAEPHYMSPEYLKLMEKVYAEADRLGMHHYLYDEGGFPSGTALGEVVASDPERFSRQFWVPDKKTGKYKLIRETLDAPMPYSRAGYPNLMEKGVGEKFIELSHEKIKSIAGECFGRSILYTFTDEPVLPGYLDHFHYLGWCSDFSEEFFKRKGYKVEPFIKEITRTPSSRDSEDVLKHRIDYCDVRAQLFAERYLTPIRDWARKNQLGSGGHFGGEDCPESNYCCAYGHIMRSLRLMDLPGVDVIWRQIYPKTRQHKKNVVVFKRKFDPVTSAPRNAPFTKYASSVARQSGKNHVLSEDFAAFGAGLMPQVMRFVIDHQLLRGATNFVFSNIPHDYYGELLASGCRPKFGRFHQFWDWFDMIHTYTARMAAMLSQGTPVVNTLVYYDVPSIWCGGKIQDKAIREHFRSAEELLKNHIDFDFVDDDALIGGKIVDGKFKVGKLCYDTIVVPCENRMFPEAAEMVEKFRKHGGRVLTTREISRITPTMKISANSSSLRVVKRQSGAETLYFITNEAQRNVKAGLTIPESGEVQFFDAWSGKRYRVERHGDTVKWNFCPFGSVLLVVNSAVKADADLPVFRPGRMKIDLVDNWTIRPVRQSVYNKDIYAIEKRDDAPVPVKLGDWRGTLGEWFSGEAVYRVEFDSPSDKPAKLSLGEVCYVSEAILNGKSLGRSFADTPEFSTDGVLKKGKNVLEVRVVNTGANAILDPEVMKYWAENYPESVYQQMNYTFEKESLESGLLGPVTIRFAAG
ncbi:MAG: hypothetical protein E7057_05310 [Lentisphaerae bacterium]|nr:hypothetical protein [Lentisphaerota bacterium]